MTRFGSLFLSAVLTLCLTGCDRDADATLPPPPPHPHGQALWRIVHDECLPHQKNGENPAPCALVSHPAGTQEGYVLLKDRRGIAQYLLMPTQKITGIEDPALLAPRDLNYFDLAWNARGWVERRLGRTLPPGFYSVTVNSRYGRSQDLLHLHLDCLSPDAHRDLKAVSEEITGNWSPRTYVIDGHPYRIRTLRRADLPRRNLFRLLVRGIPDAARNMGAWTLALTGTERADELYLLAGKADPTAGEWGSAERLQDHACRLTD